MSQLEIFTNICFLEYSIIFYFIDRFEIRGQTYERTTVSISILSEIQFRILRCTTF